ncbi:MAG TPA: c-type cytochrome [Luteibaculaceae bacterium]|nr:c-type cytochrome [Luteibaculaceae bacterium]
MLTNHRALGRFTKAVVSLSVLLTLFVTPAFAQPNGEALFKGNCASCHKPTDKRLTGPGLKGVQDRWAGKEALLKQWIKNPNAVIATGDPYVKQLVADYASSGIMPAQAVNDAEIDAILSYIANYKDPAPAGPTPGTDTVAQPTGDEDNTKWYVVIASLLVIVVFSLAGVRKSLYNSLAEKKGLPTTDGLTYWESFKLWMGKNRAIVTIVIVFLFVMGAKDTYDALMSIGVYEGYKPTQPIAFSHKIHAGQNKVNCVYCHSSVEKSKHAGIPSANVCMNCHKAVQEGKITGTAEIAKIYEAVGWDVDKQAYTGEEKPIQWVKIHNLPDHAYFNHSQHVVVGKVECQECHGKIEEMEVVEQHAPLTMGWCIKCHGEKEVQMADNGYYDEIHNRLTKAELKKYLNDDEKISVKELGGWECAKCHY